MCFKRRLLLPVDVRLDELKQLVVNQITRPCNGNQLLTHSCCYLLIRTLWFGPGYLAKVGAGLKSPQSFKRGSNSAFTADRPSPDP